MRQTVWTCDRCGRKHVYTAGVVICRDFRPSAFRDEQLLDRPSGWEEMSNDETVVDVCVWCLTDEERGETERRRNEIPF
jgi:hypothetical protein